MGRRKTTFEFIQEAQAVHGDLYDYSKVDYQSGKKKVLIIDPEYGEFWQAAGNHLTGQGNPKRGKLRGGKTRKKTTEQFIKEATKVHGGLYDYSKTEYQDSSTKVFIIDPDYGEFWQLPLAHLKGFGSFKRGVDKSKKSRIKSLDVFIKEAAEIHGDLYDYSKVEYINTHTKVLIIDPDYGEFWQTPRNHLSGQGNPKRGVIKSQKSQTDTTEDFVRKAIEIHDDLYDYSKVKYVDSYTKVLIIDPDYGEFWQAPNSHLKGVGNPARKGGVRITTDEFIKRAKAIHGDLYDYSKVRYKGAFEKVLINDLEYGEFWQEANQHLQGSGNPQRSGNVKLDRNEFIKRAKAIHGGFYNYSKVEYVNIDTPVVIIDIDYGEFVQRPEVHLRGAGHPSRSHYGFDSQKPAILYYLRINNGEAYKIGITGNSLVERFGSDMQHINVVKIWEYKVGEGAYIREQEILLKYAEFKYTGDYLLKSGNTELFFKDVLGLDV